MNLPKICPKCGIDLIDDGMYYARGIQYCTGMVTDFEKEEGDIWEKKHEQIPMLEIEMSDYPESYWIDPYGVRCGECEHILWKRTIFVNEEKFFVKKGEENEV